MRPSESDRHELLQFFGGYFNQDFSMLDSWIGEQSSDGVLAYIIATYPVYYLRRTLAPLMRLQALNLPEDELHALMFRLGAEWSPTIGDPRPPGWPNTYVEWLDQIVSKLQAGLSAKIQTERES